MYRKITFFTLWISILVSCNTNTAFSSYTSLKKVWEKDEKIDFIFQATDTINRHNMFITVRNNEAYKFSNLFLIATLHTPDGQIISDTLEYAMAKPNGEWLGKGFTSIKESKLWYKEDIVFSTAGAYRFSLEHAMRENGSADGIKQLEGITDIGIKIEMNNE